MPAGSRPHKRVLALTSTRTRFYIGSVKWRNQLLALFCLIAFFAFGVFYFRYWVIQKPFGIILFIGEGLDSQTLAEARIRAGGMEKPLALDSLAYTALLKNYSADSPVPDPAAAATALATGSKVPNGMIAMDAAEHSLPNLLDLARDAGRMTGLITNGHVTNPTAACFYAHSTSPDNWQDFADQLVKTGDLDLVLGAGAADFLPSSLGGRRSDERDLLTAARKAGYDYIRTLAELEEVPRWRRAKLLGLFSNGDLAFGDELEALDQPTLSDMVRRGIELLQYHRGGYLLVVDGRLMRTARQHEDPERRLAEAVEFDRAVSVALQYTGNKSTIFVCSDVVDSEPASAPPDPNSSPSAVPAPEASIPPAAESSSPTESPVDSTMSATSTAETPTADAGVSAGVPATRPDKEVMPHSSAAPSAEDVVAFGSGLGADALHGTQDNTAIFAIIRDNL